MNLRPRNLEESSLSRIMGHIKGERNFGVVSAFRGGLGKKENMERHAELKDAVRDMGYGFIEMRGGYKEEDGGFVNELSLFVSQMFQKEISWILGSKYDQDSVIFKDNKQFSLIGTNRATGRGTVMVDFKGGDRDSITLAQDAIKDFFSSLLKGSQRGKKFLFQTEDLFIEEKEILSFNEVAYLSKTPRWFQI